MFALRIAHTQTCDCTTNPIIVNKNTDKVTNPDAGSLRWAINCKNACGSIIKPTIKFDLKNDTIILKGQIVIEKPIAINGTGRGIVIDGRNFSTSSWGAGDSGFDVRSSRVDIIGLTFYNFIGNNQDSKEAIEVTSENRVIEAVEISGNQFFKLTKGTNGITLGSVDNVKIHSNYFGTSDKGKTVAPISGAGIRIAQGNDANPNELRTYDIYSNFIYGCTNGILVLQSFVQSAQINIYKNVIGALGLKNGTGINALGPGAKFEIKDDTIRFNTIGIKIENARNASRIKYNTISENIQEGILLDGTNSILNMAIDSNSIRQNAYGIHIKNENARFIQMIGNAFACNTSQGIEITPNANNKIRPPVIASAVPSEIIGTISSSTVRTNYFVHVYTKDTTCELSCKAPYQGLAFIGTATVVGTDWSLPKSAYKIKLRHGQLLVATLTAEAIVSTPVWPGALEKSALAEIAASTSEFSACKPFIDPCYAFATVHHSDTTLCDKEPFSIKATIVNGTAPFSVGWKTIPSSNPFGVVVKDEVIPFREIDLPLSNPVVATYVINVRDNIGCTSSDTFTLRISTNLKVKASNDTTLCSGSPAVLRALASGGIPQYKYLWSSGETTAKITTSSLLQSTQRVVTATDALGCIAKDTVKIQLDPAALVFAGSDQTLCGDAQVALKGTRSGVTNTTNWISNGTGVFGNKSLLNTTYTPSTQDTARGEVTLTLISNDPPGLCPPDSSSLKITWAGSGNLVLEKIAPSSCLAEDGAIHIKGLVPVQSYTVSYKDNGLSKNKALFTDDLGLLSISDLDVGTYTELKVLDAKLGCSFALPDATLTITPVEASRLKNICPDLEAIISLVDVTGYSSIAWRDMKNGDATGYTITQSGADVNFNAKNATPGTANLLYTATYANGCQLQGNYNITILPRPKPTILATDQSSLFPNDGIICKGDSVQLSVAENFPLIQWSTGTRSKTLVRKLPGNISVLVEDANGCQGNNDFNVTVYDLPMIQAKNQIPLSCNLGNDGAIDITPAGGTQPYNFLWSNGTNQEDVDELNAGIYTVTLTDENLCETSTQFELPEPSPIEITLVDTNSVTGPRTMDGTALVDIKGGTSGYTLKWLGPKIDSTFLAVPNRISITGLIAGSYKLIVKDKNDCETDTDFSIGGFSCHSSNPGTLSGQTQKLCPGQQYVANFFTAPSVLLPSERLEYILHDQPNELLGEILSRSSTPSIAFFLGLKEGKTYYLSAVIGPVGTNGQIDLSSPCLSVSKGTPIVFVAPPPVRLGKIRGSNDLCPYEALQLEVMELPGTERFAWMLPSGDTLFTQSPTLKIESVQLKDAGTYRVSAEKNGCTLDQSDPYLLNVLGLENGERIDAGADITTCSKQIQLKARAITSGTGEWLPLSNARIVDKKNPLSTVNNLENGSNLMVWIVSTLQCGEIGRDTVEVVYGSSVLALSDHYDLKLETGQEVVLEILKNDTFSFDFRTNLTILQEPTFGKLKLQQNLDPRKISLTFQDPEGTRGTTQFIYQVCQLDNACPQSCDTAIVNLKTLHLPALADGFTPNENSLNDKLAILAIGQGNADLKMEIKIFNRWGDIVFTHQNYIPETEWWDGKHSKTGALLPPGAYYALIKYIDPKGEVFPQVKTIYLLK